MGKRRRTQELQEAAVEAPSRDAEPSTKRKRRPRRDEKARGTSESSSAVRSTRGIEKHGDAIGPIEMSTSRNSETDIFQDARADLLAQVSDLAGTYQDLDRKRLLSFSSQLIDLAFPILGETPSSALVVQPEAEKPSIKVSDSKILNSNMIRHKRFEAFESELAQIKREQHQQQQQQNSIIAILQAETATLRQEVEMTIIQREQQRQWNKNALNDQANSFREELDLLKKQIKNQEKQQQEVRELRAKHSELKAALSSIGSKKPVSHDTRPHDHAAAKIARIQREQKEAAAPKIIEPVHVPPPEPVMKELNLIKSSIAARQTQWNFFLSQKGNYMFAPNLENGLRDVLREIRQFNIRHPKGGYLAFDLVMLATNTLFMFSVAGADSEQDFYSIPLKLAAWKQMDEFAAILLRGFGWRNDEAELALRDLLGQKTRLVEVVRERLPDFEVEGWFSLTSAGLEKCVGRK